MPNKKHLNDVSKIAEHILELSFGLRRALLQAERDAAAILARNALTLVVGDRGSESSAQTNENRTDVYVLRVDDKSDGV